MSDNMEQNTTETISYDDVINKLTEQIASMKVLITQVKQLKKEHNSKLTKKKEKVKKERDPNKPPPFSKPVEISDELFKFLDLTENISRTDITKMMYKYIKDEALQNQDHKRQFIIDENLSKLFKIDKGDSIEYFKLQTHMKQHYK